VPLAFRRVFWQTWLPSAPMPHFFPALMPLRLLWPSALAFTVLSACSGQGEGQLCSPNAGNQGNDDCQGGLVCVVSPQMYTLGRCCPQDRSKATTAVCSPNSGGIDASPAPPDASSEQAPAAETGTDASSDSTAEGGTAGDGSDGGAE
jgi:hypothetical protein